MVVLVLTLVIKFHFLSQLLVMHLTICLRLRVMDLGTSHKQSLQTRTDTFSNQFRQFCTLRYILRFSSQVYCILQNEHFLQAGPRGEREIQFYRTITEGTDSSLAQFQPFIPSFYGSCTKKDGQFMMIENATMRMTRPCIMDIKVRRHQHLTNCFQH